jgi:hypothetical protein
MPSSFASDVVLFIAFATGALLWFALLAWIVDLIVRPFRSDPRQCRHPLGDGRRCRREVWHDGEHRP